MIHGPCIVGENAEIRHGALIRGAAFVGNGAVLGNSCELKNCILFDSAQIPHFNYVGDSIVGYRAHIGAGVITSNLKNDKTNVSVHINGAHIQTGLRKLGAMIGDFAEIGCNCVLNPGTVIGKEASIYPLTSIRGYIPAGHIVKKMGDILKNDKKHESEE